ncbi:hypothetical protein Purlil1_11282 [Purpureocillium lilacinum]|uniref:RTA1 domain-containingprotein n=1 Tax=Purpureocillium lilacinum TaxID=33203 RepID=A0ABR0BJY0_PURLI|nr:hypothetical protein Purlil1_11282 [Purpureocillium lilacinum]
MAASILFTLLFVATTAIHVIQALYHRTWYCWVIIVSGLLQTITYLCRDLSIKYPANETYYVLWFVLILIASVWTNAFVYMVFGRLVWRFKYDRSVLGMRAWHYGLVFVIFDIFAFIVQIAGAAQAAGNDVPEDKVMRGLHIYMGGVGIQQLFILGFCVAVFVFWRDFRRQEAKSTPPHVFGLVYTLVAVLILVTIRIIFRLIEYANGLESSIPEHEVYQYALDSLPMLIALVLFNIVHPGRVMPAHETKIPSFPERRRQKREGVNIQLNPHFASTSV